MRIIYFNVVCVVFELHKAIIIENNIMVTLKSGISHGKYIRYAAKKSSLEFFSFLNYKQL